MKYMIDPELFRGKPRAPEQVELTIQQKREWGNTRARFVFQCPAFSHILYELMTRGREKHLALFTRSIYLTQPDGKRYYPPAAMDGKHLIIHPEEFFKYNLDERLFIVAHEVCHGIFNHAELLTMLRARGHIAYPDGVTLEFSEEIMQIAMDAVINDLLINAGTGKMPHRDGKPAGVHMPQIITSKDNVVDAYRKLYNHCGGPGGAGGKGMEVFDLVLAPGAAEGQDQHDAAADRNAGQWKVGIASAIALAKAVAQRGQGQDAAELERIFGELLMPKQSWKDLVIGFFARKVGGASLDWHRPDRRLICRSMSGMGEDIFMPGASGHGVGTVVVGGDTSGSITDEVLNVWFGHLAGILEDLNPKRLVIMWCDAKLQRVDEVEDAHDLNTVRHKGAPGGGGTDFRPMFDEIKRMGLEPDAFILLTDTFGRFPEHAPDYPFLIGSIVPEERASYPYGDFVYIDDLEG